MGTIDLTKATPKYLTYITVLLTYSSKIYVKSIVIIIIINIKKHPSFRLAYQ